MIRMLFFGQHYIQAYQFTARLHRPPICCIHNTGATANNNIQARNICNLRLFGNYFGQLLCLLVIARLFDFTHSESTLLLNVPIRWLLFEPLLDA
jgi:hypothetical protein